MESKQLLEVLKTRRSVRKFTQDAMPDNDIKTIITAASWAPSGTNHQNWHFIVVKSRNIIDDIAVSVVEKVKEYASSIKMESARHGFLNYTNYFSFFKDAPCVIVVVKKPYDSITQKLMRRYGLSDDFMASTDVQGPAAAIQNLLLMVHALGYGACWMTGPLIAKKEIEAILNIKEPDVLMALIPVGRASHLPPAPKRKEVEGIVDYI